MIDDRGRDLGTVLSYLVGRPVRTVELAKALGVARSSYCRIQLAPHLYKAAGNVLSEIAEVLSEIDEVLA